MQTLKMKQVLTSGTLRQDSGGLQLLFFVELWPLYLWAVITLAKVAVDGWESVNNAKMK